MRILSRENHFPLANKLKPFGNGMRACIGRPFAWQEALLAVATLLQVFRFTKAHPSYTLKIRTSLTIKPKDFYIRAHVRDPDFLSHAGVLGGETQTKNSEAPKSSGVQGSANLRPLQILFGSNTGTCEAVAQALAGTAADHGFKADVKTLDAAVSSLNKDIPIVIVTASYEGLPPENAAHFVEWLKSEPADEVKNVRFAVFGVGNSKWKVRAQTESFDSNLFCRGVVRNISKGTHLDRRCIG